MKLNAAEIPEQIIELLCSANADSIELAMVIAEGQGSYIDKIRIHKLRQ